MVGFGVARLLLDASDDERLRERVCYHIIPKTWGSYAGRHGGG